MEGIQVSLEKVGPQRDISVIKVGGYIDTTTSAELEHSLSSLLKSNSYNIVIDLGNVDYISSAGWGMFISEIKGIRERHGDLKLVRMIPDVFEVFELLEFHYILKAFDTLEEAISDFDQNGGMTTAALGTEEQSDSDDAVFDGPEPTLDMASESPGSDYEVEQSKDSSEGSIEEKLRQLVIEKPDLSVRQLIRELDSPSFGNIRLGWFQMRKYLKRLELNSRKKRMEFFKEKATG